MSGVRCQVSGVSKSKEVPGASKLTPHTSRLTPYAYFCLLPSAYCLPPTGFCLRFVGLGSWGEAKKLVDFVENALLLALHHGGSGGGIQVVANG